MEQMIDVYYRIVATSGYRERERLYEKARHDEAQALYHARNEGRKEGREEARKRALLEAEAKGLQEAKFEAAQNMKAMDYPLHEIVRLTGLSYAEVENL